MSGKLKSGDVPGPNVGFTDLVDACLDADDTVYDAFPLRPSNAGKCSRALAAELYQWLGRGKFPQEQKDPNVKRLLSLGSSVEYHVIRHFDMIPKANRDFRISYKQQVLVVGGLDPANSKDTSPPLVKGSLDFGVEHIREQWAIFLDCKSAKDKFSVAHATKWDETTEHLNEMNSTQAISETAWWVEDLEAFVRELGDPFFEDNFLQLNIYCCTDFAKSINVIAGSILRYNKNDSRWIEVRFKPHPGLAAAFMSKANSIYKAAKNWSLEDIRAKGCEFPPGHIKHAFCNCHLFFNENAEAARKAYFRTFPPKKWATDTDKFANKKDLESLFAAYEESLLAGEEAERLEADILRKLREEHCLKVRLPNSHVYEVRHFKTGGPANGPRICLRRTKT